MHIAVCVTGQKTCERLIQEGAQLRTGDADELSVLHVAKRGAHLLGNPNEAEALEYLFRVSNQSGASMMMLRSDDAAEAIVGFVEKHGVDILLLGRAGKPKLWDLAAELRARMPELDIRTVWA